LSERNVKHNEDDNEVGQHYHQERNNSLPELFGDEATQNDWEKYWAKNGERLIWQSWIEKYIDYINPEYLDPNKMPIFDAETSADSQKLSLGEGEAFTFEAQNSTEIVISPPAKASSDNLKLQMQGWNQLESKNYLHQNDNENLLLSPRCDSMSSSIPFTIGATTDSMTNVTRISCTSYGFESSHVTSESTPTSSSSSSDESVSSFSSEDSDEENQMATTRAAYECEKLLMENKPEEHLLPSNDQDSEEYWQKRWQNHAQEQYVKHYNKFMEAHRILQDEMSSSFKSDSGFLPGEMNSSSNSGNHKRRKKSGRKKNHSLQRLVANLHLRNEKITKPTENPTDADESHHHEQSDSTVIDTTETSLMESLGLPTSFGTSKNGAKKNNGGGDEPPEEKPITLKRAHESEGDEAVVDHIKSQFDMMGYAFVDKNSSESTTTKGEIVYRKKHVRLHNRMLKMLPGTSCKSKHTFFDDDGNEINESEQEILQHSSSDEDAPIQPINSRINNSIVPFTSQLSSDGNANEESEQKEEVNINLSIDDGVEESMQLNDEEKQAVRRERKRKRKGKFQTIIPAEMNDKVLKKYWYKRFSLFSFFDQGIQLDRGEFI
jgi:trimethylguanosine synthase